MRRRARHTPKQAGPVGRHANGHIGPWAAARWTLWALCHLQPQRHASAAAQPATISMGAPALRSPRAFEHRASRLRRGRGLAGSLWSRHISGMHRQGVQQMTDKTEDGCWDGAGTSASRGRHAFLAAGGDQRNQRGGGTKDLGRGLGWRIRQSKGMQGSCSEGRKGQCARRATRVCCVRAQKHNSLSVPWE